jgi:hypothetical protein
LNFALALCGVADYGREGEIRGAGLDFGLRAPNLMFPVVAK